MSDSPIAAKLQVKGARTLALIDAPAAADSAIAASDVRTAAETADVVVAFVPARAVLETNLPIWLKAIRTDAILWIAYPKLTSKLAGDLNRDIIHGLAPAYGIDTVSQIAIDADWSAMRMKRLPG